MLRNSVIIFHMSPCFLFSLLIKSEKSFIFVKIKKLYDVCQESKTIETPNHEFYALFLFPVSGGEKLDIGRKTLEKRKRSESQQNLINQIAFVAKTMPKRGQKWT